MQQRTTVQDRRRWDSAETLLLSWIAAAAFVAGWVSSQLNTSFPLFTFIWLALSLVALFRWRDAARLGFRRIPRHLLWSTTGANLALLLLVMMLVEPWSHIYGTVATEAAYGPQPDPTFVWLDWSDSLAGPIIMFLFSGLVTLFAEELCFRGWLLQLLLRRFRPTLAIGLQAALFAIPQSLTGLLLPPWQGLLWIVVYSWLAIGVIGGWAAYRTGSIWPSLLSATLVNLVLVLLAVW